MTSSGKQSAKLEPIPFILWGQAIIIVLGAFTSMLSSTMLNTALPSIAASLNTSNSIAQWIATGYFLSLAAGVPLSAWLSRKLGPTKLWLISLVLFMVFSILCAESKGIYMLIICRVLQGLSGGLLVPAGQIITSIAAGPKRLGRVVSIVGIAVVVAPTLGTTLSSAILSSLSWPWLFWINIPLGVVAFFAGLKWLPKIEVSEAGKFDWIGFLFVLSGVPLLIYGVTSIGNTANAVPIGTSIIIGAVLIIGFVVRSLRRDKPILQLRLFGNGVFSVAAVVMFLGGAINFGAQLLLPHYLTDVRHLSLLTASQLILPQVIGTAVGFPLAGRFTDRYGAGRLIFTGGIIMTISMLSLIFIEVNAGTTWVALIFFIWGLGTALATVPAMTAGLTTVAPDQIPDSSPILNMLQRIGASIGTALITLLYTKNLTVGLDQAHALVVFKNVVWVLLGSILVLLISSLTLVLRENKNAR
ncbi:DHA2 family efflux MFS transporter permease subunit [Brevibacillus reuszeri]|uniref:DHA2 family efflux MFS transporter permease subunit n=1 Tax=Brevibacillus reuszeri TaxID=54915 RepID=UPI003D215712